MFVLVLMSMGQRGGILLDCNSQPVDLVKIRDLLSPFKFPAMRGKPKMLIIQACSGGKFCIIVTTCWMWYATALEIIMNLFLFVYCEPVHCSNPFYH